MLDICKSVRHAEGGVLQVVEGVVGQHELVAFHPERLWSHAEEPSVLQNVELVATFQLESPHRDPIESTPRDPELIDIVEVEGERRHSLHNHAVQLENVFNLDAFESVAFRLQFFHLFFVIRKMREIATELKYILPHRQIKYPVDFDDELKTRKRQIR